ncbi:hypothetical protein C8R44DRAFT_886322 [Mycena epipterygia]|nr:hypothetical protein C8R44DRAFT_886322 [Mycena epipterygia]
MFLRSYFDAELSHYDYLQKALASSAGEELASLVYEQQDGLSGDLASKTFTEEAPSPQESVLDTPTNLEARMDMKMEQGEQKRRISSHRGGSMLLPTELRSMKADTLELRLQARRRVDSKILGTLEENEEGVYSIVSMLYAIPCTTSQDSMALP